MVEKKVAILVYWGWLSLSPSLVSAIKLLSENGYVVQVVYLYDKKFGIFEPKIDRVQATAIMPPRKTLINLLRFLITSFRIVNRDQFKFLIGVDQEGIIVAGILGMIQRISYIYYSLEILLKKDVAKKRGIKRLFLRLKKSLESYFSRHANITIVQDWYRGNALIEDNALDKRKIIIVPNSYYFSNRKNNNYEINMPPISNEKKIIIYTGSIIPEMAIEEIIKHLTLWPEDTFFILHTPYKNTYLEYIQLLIKKNKLSDRVFVSIKKLNFEELCLLIKKAHIGLSFYTPINRNFVLSPSGKISFYLSQGVPIIANTVPSVRDLISKYKCGVFVNSFEEVGNGIRFILENHSEFSKNAKKCYEQELEFSKYFSKVIEHMQ